MGVLLACLLFFSAVNISLAAGSDAALNGLNATAGTAGLKDNNTDLPATIGNIVGAGLAFVGVVFMILIIYGGLLWMTSRGNEQQVEKAKDLIYSAVIGLIIVLSAYAITFYIGGILGQTSPGTPAETPPASGG